MRRIFAWLNKKRSRDQLPAATKQPRVHVAVEPEAVSTDEYTIDSSFDPAVPGRIESDATGKNILMPDIYGDQPDPTEPLLDVLDQSSPDVDASSGFNPYDTVVLHEKKPPKKR